MPNLPLVNINIPTYNSAKYLKLTLDSIFAQSYPNIKITLIDNKSSDDTINIAKEYLNLGRQFVIIVNEKNIGGEANFNKALEISDGEYIAIFHSDDVYHKDIILEYVNHLSKNRDVGAISCMGEIIDENNNKTGASYSLPPEFKGQEKAYLSFTDLYSSVLKHGNSFLICPSVMIRRSVYLELGGFEFEKFKSSSDLGLWLKISLHSRFSIIDKKLISYRIHSSQGSKSLVRESKSLPDLLLPVKFYYHSLGPPDQNKLRDSFLLFVTFQILRTLKKRLSQGHFSSRHRLLVTAFRLLKRTDSLNFSAQKIKHLCIFMVLVIDSYLLRGYLSKFNKS